jgi:hypothetical protein
VFSLLGTAVCLSGKGRYRRPKLDRITLFHTRQQYLALQVVRERDRRRRMGDAGEEEGEGRVGVRTREKKSGSDPIQARGAERPWSD